MGGRYVLEVSNSKYLQKPAGYIIYFVTLTLTAALMYSFLALGFSSDVLAMAENMSMLTTGILLMSALVAFLSSFVIGYAIRFMLEGVCNLRTDWHGSKDSTEFVPC